jgi:hypothetical protein
MHIAASAAKAFREILTCEKFDLCKVLQNATVMYVRV